MIELLFKNFTPMHALLPSQGQLGALSLGWTKNGLNVISYRISDLTYGTEKINEFLNMTDGRIRLPHHPPTITLLDATNWLVGIGFKAEGAITYPQLEKKFGIGQEFILISQTGMLRYLREEEDNLYRRKILIVGFLMDNMIFTVGPGAKTHIMDGKPLMEKPDKLYDIPSFGDPWYSVCFVDGSKALTKEVILWKQIVVVIFHFLFRISGAKIADLNNHNKSGMKKFDGWTTPKICKFFVKGRHFQNTSAPEQILKAMCGDKDNIIGGVCEDYRYSISKLIAAVDHNCFYLNYKPYTPTPTIPAG